MSLIVNFTGYTESSSENQKWKYKIIKQWTPKNPDKITKQNIPKSEIIEESDYIYDTEMDADNAIKIVLDNHMMNSSNL